MDLESSLKQFSSSGSVSSGSIEHTEVVVGFRHAGMIYDQLLIKADRSIFSSARNEDSSLHKQQLGAVGPDLEKGIDLLKSCAGIPALQTLLDNAGVDHIHSNSCVNECPPQQRTPHLPEDPAHSV